jgi:4-amino-4-deoxy-L-arabinose transferase-like glycosyltransferase
VLLLGALCLVLYLPGLASIPPVDRDEARFAQTTRQMIESGDFVRPRFQEQDRFRKPVGIYWLQALSVALTGPGTQGSIWPYRLPSVVGGLVAVLLTYCLGATWYAPRVALVGAALLGTSLLLVVEAHLATTDAVLLALIVAAQGCLGVVYMHARQGRPASAVYAYGFWLAQGLAILVKGPVAPLISVLTIATLLWFDGRANLLMSQYGSRNSTRRRGSAGASLSHRNTRNGRFLGRSSGLIDSLRWRQGICIVLAVLLPWGSAVARATDGAFFRGWLTTDLLPKLVGGHESHGALPGLHLLLLPATFWPGSIALAPALLLARARRRRPGERFLLAWLVPAWLLFELIPTKLPHYVLPLLPPLALLCARALLAPAAWWRRLPRWVHGGSVIWAMLSVAASIALILVAPKIGGHLGPAAVAGVFGFALCTLVTVRFALHGSWNHVAPAAVAASIVLSATTFGTVLPDLHALWISRAVATAVAQRPRAAAGTQLAAVGYHEPSLVFLTGSDVALLDPDALAGFLRDHPQSLGLITADERRRFDAAAATLGVHAHVVWSGEGINYSKGRRIRLQLLARTAEADLVSGAGATPTSYRRKPESRNGEPIFP